VSGSECRIRDTSKLILDTAEQIAMLSRA